MELHAVRLAAAVPQSHDDAVLATSGDLKLVRHIQDGQRVIPHRGELRWQPREDPLPIVPDQADVAVRRFDRPDPATERDRQALMPQAYPE
jgi:hypothetical protein